MRGRRLMLLVLGSLAAVACGLSAVGSHDAVDGGASSTTPDASFPRGNDGSLPQAEDGSIAVDGGDGGAANDAGGKGDAGDAGIVALCDPSKVFCGGTCVTATSCAACAGAPYLCGTTRACLASCATCTDPTLVPMPIECIACNPSQNNPVGSCAYNSTSSFCLSADYSKAYNGGAGEHCNCNNTQVSNCLGKSQVCKSHSGTDWCITCGEADLSTNGLPCKGGGSCNTGVSPPRCM